MIVLETEPQLAEYTLSLAKIQIPGSTQRFQEKLQLDLHDILTSAELKFRFLPQQETIENHGCDMPRKKSLREDLRLKDPDHNPASSELLEHIGLERFNAKKREPSSTKKRGTMEQRGNSCEAPENADESSEQSF